MSWRNRGWAVSQIYDHGAFDERAFHRASFPTWDPLWQNLSVAARASFLDEVKIPPGNDPDGADRLPSTEIGRFDPDVLGELAKAGFVELRSGQGRPPISRVLAAEGVQDFALRLRTLRRHHLLGTGKTDAAKAYIASSYYASQLNTIVIEVLRRVGINEYLRLEDALERYVLTHRWIDWMVFVLKDPLAASIVERVVQAGGPVSLAELAVQLNKAEPAAVRTSVDQLIAHLVLFEDLDAATHELRLGVLPAVRQSLVESRRPRQRPALVVCSNLKDVGPDEGHLIADLRAVLLELASAPARLKLDRSLFLKEDQRLEAVIEPLPGWLSEVLRLTVKGRLRQSLQIAKSLRLVKDAPTGSAHYLRLTAAGQEWLIGSMDDQFLAVVGAFRSRAKPAEPYSMDTAGLMEGIDVPGYSSRDDSRFLGVNIASLPVKKDGHVPGLWESGPENIEPLRRALDGIFSALPVGIYHRLDSVVSSAIFGEHNPLLLGTRAVSDRLAIYANGQLIPPLADRLEDTARSLLLMFLGSRLFPLGCARIAVDEHGGMALARDPRLDAYFGRPIVREPDGGTKSESKVVVQPDYSVVIIGPNAAPAAALLPFCERTSTGSGRGALVLKLTRDSVLQAIARGLAPAEVLVRLRRHATHELPANVVREVEGWAGWVRHIHVERLTVLRCPDSESADRVMGALPKKAERIHETMVAIPPSQLTSVEHQKLLAQGIIVGSTPGGDQLEPGSKAKPKPKSRQKRRRRV